MVFWVLAPFPGSAYSGIEWHDQLASNIWSVLHFNPLIGPETMVLKYNTLGQAPALLHALPGAIWCGLAPFQLARAGSGAERARSHSWAGRVMLASAAVLMVGYALIEGGGLTADDYDFGGHQGWTAELVEGTALWQLVPMSFNHAGLKVLAGWFVWSGYKTYKSARDKEWAAHKAWAVRHVGAGLWVAAQRPLFAAARASQALLLGTDASFTAGAQADAFYTTAQLVTVLYYVGAELIARGIWLPAKEDDSDGDDQQDDTASLLS